MSNTDAGFGRDLLDIMGSHGDGFPSSTVKREHVRLAVQRAANRAEATAEWAGKAFKECGRCRFPQGCYTHGKCRDDYYREQSSGPADGHIAQAQDIHEPLAPVGVVEQPRQGKVVGSNPSMESAGSVPLEEAGTTRTRSDKEYSQYLRYVSSNAGPAVDSQLTSEPSPEGAGASAAGSADPSGRFTDGGKTWEPAASQVQGALTPLGEAMEWLRDARIDHWNMDHVAKCSNAILSHIAAQQAEIERLNRLPHHDVIAIQRKEIAGLQNAVKQLTTDAEHLVAECDYLKYELADHEAVHADKRRLVRELDVLLNGEDGAAKQASLCDIVSQIKTTLPHLAAQQAEIGRLTEEANEDDQHNYDLTRDIHFLQRDLAQLTADRDRLARELEEARKWQEWGEKYLGVIGNSLYASRRVAAAMENNNSGISEALAAMPTEKL